jgi:hypothetical protein
LQDDPAKYHSITLINIFVHSYAIFVWNLFKIFLHLWQWSVGTFWVYRVANIWAIDKDLSIYIVQLYKDLKWRCSFHPEAFLGWRVGGLWLWFCSYLTFSIWFSIFVSIFCLYLFFFFLADYLVDKSWLEWKWEDILMVLWILWIGTSCFWIYGVLRYDLWKVEYHWLS